MEAYEQGWIDGVKECLKLAKSIDDTYMINCLEKLLENE